MAQAPETPAENDRNARLSEFLGGLHPNTQAAVLRELELSELRGDELGPSFKKVMNELRRGIRRSGRMVERVGNPSRIFFMPVQPFLISEIAEKPIPATLSRVSLNPIWAWICRDLVPAEARTYIETAKQALLEDDRASAVFAATVFQDKFVAAATPFVRGDKNPSLHKRLSAYGAPRTGLSDLQAIFYVMQNRDALRNVVKLFPTKLREVDKAVVEQVTAMLAALPQGDAAMRRHALAILMSQLSPAWLVLRFATIDASLRELITGLVLGRMEAAAAALATGRWSIEHSEDAAEKARFMRATLDALYSEVCPSDGSPEDRRGKEIERLVARFESKIAHVMAMKNGARPSRPADGAGRGARMAG